MRNPSRSASPGPSSPPPPPDARALTLPPIRTDDASRRAPAPVSAESAASIQAQLSSSLSAALLGSASAAYRAPYVARSRSRSRSPAHSPSPAPTDAPRHRSSSTGARHASYAPRQHTYPFSSRDRSPPLPTLAPIGRPDYAQALPPFHAAAGLPPALPAPPNTKPLEQFPARYGPGDSPRSRHPSLAHRPDSSPASPPGLDPRKSLLAQPIQAPAHVGALQAAPHVGAFHSMPVVGVFQGTAPQPAELPISVWQAHPLVRTRARITREQLRALEALFAKTWFPTSQQRAEAANVTGMREYSVTVWFQNRRSKAKKEGLQPPEGDKSKLRKDKGPKRDLGTHVFEPTAPDATPTQKLIWLEDARSRGQAPVMKTSSPVAYAEPAREHAASPQSWTEESDVEMTSETDTRRSHSRQSRPGTRDGPLRASSTYGRAYTQHSADDRTRSSYFSHDRHSSYTPTRDQESSRNTRKSDASSQCSTPSAHHPTPARSPSNDSRSHTSYARRRSSAHTESEDEPEPRVRTTTRAGENGPESEPNGRRPTKRSRRENEHPDTNNNNRNGATTTSSPRHRASPECDQPSG